MGVPALGHPLTVQPRLRQRVPFGDRHPPVRISQDAGREQPAHAGAQHHRVLTGLTHLLPPPPGTPGSLVLQPRDPLQPPRETALMASSPLPAAFPAAQRLHGDMPSTQSQQARACRRLAHTRAAVPLPLVSFRISDGGTARS